MLTTDAMNTIHNDISKLYMKKKTGLSAGKYTFNPDAFPGEDMLTKQIFFQALKNWLKLLSSIAKAEVYVGWQDHHDLMADDPLFSSMSHLLRHGRHMTNVFGPPFSALHTFWMLIAVTTPKTLTWPAWM